MFDDAEDGVTWVGFPLEVVRTLDTVYLDQARANFDDYVHGTLSASQAAGGRFNPPGEFGALYTASDDDTAWAEVAARFRRQGVDALPPRMGLLRIVVLRGRYVDLSDPATCRQWDAVNTSLAAEEATPEQREHCWDLARAVRAVADFLMSQSARSAGRNIPLFPDRSNSGMRLELQSAELRPVPPHLAQQPTERW